MNEERRSTDRLVGAFRAADTAASSFLARFWEWVDRRDVDKHVVSLAILFGTVKVTAWAMHFAENGNRPGLEVAAILAAVLAPYMALQSAAVAFYFRARQ
jgi:hypothetical protein